MSNLSFALENIQARYRSRFRPDPQSENMLFFSSEQAIPARLSYEQYNHYVEEFDAFLAKSKRKLLLHASFIFLFTIVFIGLAIYFLGLDIIDNKQFETFFMVGFMTTWMLPGLHQFWQGKKLFQKPTNELTALPEGVIAPLTTRQIVDRRFMAMSEGLIIGTGVMSALGIAATLIEGIPEEPADFKYIGLFSLAIVGSIYVWRRKARAHREDEEINDKERAKL